MNHIKSATINGKKWKWKWEPIDKEDKAVGLCYKTEHEIVIDSNLRGKLMLSAIIHETGHAADGEASEQEVERLETAIADVLWRVGDRCK